MQGILYLDDNVARSLQSVQFHRLRRHVYLIYSSRDGEYIVSYLGLPFLATAVRAVARIFEHLTRHVHAEVSVKFVSAVNCCHRW